MAWTLFAGLLLFGGKAGAQGPAGAALKTGLPKTLKGLDIGEGFIPSPGFREVARIDGLNGNVVVIHRAAGVAYYGKPGDPVFENDALETLTESRCRIRFRNEDVVTMAAETRFGVDEYREEQAERPSRSLMSVLKGKAMFYALRLFGRTRRNVTVKTPTAVAGVRGTKFGVHVYRVEESAGGRAGIRVAGIGPGAGTGLAQIEGAGRSFTDCFSEDGVVDVNGRSVTPGNMFRGRDGAVVPTPSGYVRIFESETTVRPEGTKDDGTGGQGDETGGDETAANGGDGAEDDDEGSDEAGTPLAGGEETNHAAIVDIAESVTDTTLQETGEDSNTGDEAGTDIADGKTAGRVYGISTIMLNSSGQPWFSPGTSGPFYAHGPGEIDSSPNTYRAYESFQDENEDYRLFLQETDSSGSQARVTEFDYGYGSNQALATPQTFTYFQGGAYQDGSGHSFLEWGWWEDQDMGLNGGLVGKNGGDEFYAATNKIWHVEGDRTHPDYIDYLHQQGAAYTYSGDAYGVFVDGTGPTATELNGTGGFSCRIDFGSRQVTDFHIDATGAGCDVHLSGSGTVAPDGEFNIENLSGTLSGHGTQNDSTHADGAVCGGKAEGVAGYWQAHDGSDYWASGEFHGKR